MERLKRPAILVVDMLNDFVYGALTCERGKAIVPATAALLDAARQKGVPVIFCNDAHRKGIDRECVVLKKCYRIWHKNNQSFLNDNTARRVVIFRSVSYNLFLALAVHLIGRKHTAW